MRHIYDDASTLAAEADIGRAIERRFGLKLTKLPRHYPIDYFAHKDGKGIGWIDIKDHPKFQHDSYVVSAMKVAHAHQLAAATGLPVSLIVRLNGVVYRYKFFAPEWDFALGGRTYADGSSYTEPCAFIPIDKFQRIEL